MSIRRADYKSRRNANRMRTAGEGGLSLVFASRAAVPHSVAVDYKTCWLDENVTCFKTGIAENRGIVLQFIPSNGSLWRGRWENWPDIEILVSGMYPEIAHARASKADFTIRRAHMFYRHMIQSHRSGRRNRMRTAGEGGLSSVFASRAAVPHSVAVDYKTCWLDENVTCFKTGIAENRGIVLQSTFAGKPCCRTIQSTYSTEVEGKGAHLQQQVPLQVLLMPVAVKGELQNRLPPRGCNCASQTGKVCSASIQPAW